MLSATGSFEISGASRWDDMTIPSQASDELADVTDVTDVVAAAACRIRATSRLSTTTTSFSPCRIDTSPRGGVVHAEHHGMLCGDACRPQGPRGRRSAPSGPPRWRPTLLIATIGTATAAPAVVRRRFLRDQSFMSVSSLPGGRCDPVAQQRVRAERPLGWVMSERSSLRSVKCPACDVVGATGWRARRRGSSLLIGSFVPMCQADGLLSPGSCRNDQSDMARAAKDPRNGRR